MSSTSPYPSTPESGQSGPYTGPGSARPEPVLDAQQLTRGVLAVLGALSALFALLGFRFELEKWDDLIGALIGAGVLVAGLVLPRVQAMKARRLVTPVVDPRAGDGTRLVKATPPSTPTAPPTTYGGSTPTQH